MAEATTGKEDKRHARAYAATVRAVPGRTPRRTAAATILGLAPQELPTQRTESAEAPAAAAPPPEVPVDVAPVAPQSAEEAVPIDVAPVDAVPLAPQPEAEVTIDVTPLELQNEPPPRSGQRATQALDPLDEAYEVPTNTSPWLQALLIVFSFGLYGIYLLLTRKR